MLGSDDHDPEVEGSMLNSADIEGILGSTNNPSSSNDLPSSTTYTLSFPATETYDSSKILKSFKNHLLCETCKKYPNSPISGCDNRHIICGQCSQSFKECGICKLGLNPILNWGKLANMIKKEFDCSKESLLFSKLTEHFAVCNFIFKEVTEDETVSLSTSKKEKTIPSLDIEKILECTICLDFASSPIYTCGNSHILCGQCAPKVKTCPTCKLSNISPSPLGDKLAKEANKTISCVYSESGCDEGVWSTKFIEHVALCNYRDIECVWPNCNKQLPFNKYSEHLKSEHAAATFNGGCEMEPIHFTAIYSQQSICVSGQYIASIVQFGNLEFIMYALEEKGVFANWIGILGGEELGNKYNCKITLGDPESTSTRYGCSWTIPILPYHEIPAGSKELDTLENYKIMKIRMPTEKDWGKKTQTDNGILFQFALKYEIRLNL